MELIGNNSAQCKFKKSLLSMPHCTIGGGQSGIRMLILVVDIYMTLFDFQFKMFDVVNYQIFIKTYPYNGKTMEKYFLLKVVQRLIFIYQRVGFELSML